MATAYTNDGDTNLRTVHKARKFTDWLFSQISPHLKGRILEVGCGIGTYSEKVVAQFTGEVVLSDVDQTYVKALQKKYQKNKRVRVSRIDITKKLKVGKLDSIFALNVLEHIEDDVLALHNLYESLNPGGRVVLLVPAHEWLFNCLDEAVDHYRRYTKKTLLATVEQTPFAVKKLFYFNFFAIFGWFWNGHILKQTELGGGLMKLFNVLVPIFSFIEKYLFRKRLGISLIIVLEKPKAQKTI